MGDFSQNVYVKIKKIVHAILVIAKKLRLIHSQSSKNKSKRSVASIWSPHFFFVYSQHKIKF